MFAFPSINLQDNDGRTALYFSVEYSATKSHEDVICVLLEHFASIRDKMGKRAFEGVRQHGEMQDLGDLLDAPSSTAENSRVSPMPYSSFSLFQLASYRLELQI